MSKLRLIGTGALALALGLFLVSGAGFLRPSFAANYGDLDLLPTVLHLVKTHYVKDVEERDLVEGAVKGMLDVLDPHTTYLSPDLYKEVQRDTRTDEILRTYLASEVFAERVEFAAGDGDGEGRGA